MAENLATKYLESMKHHSYGYAFYEPEPASVVRPGVCGYLNELCQCRRARKMARELSYNIRIYEEGQFWKMSLECQHQYQRYYSRSVEGCCGSVTRAMCNEKRRLLGRSDICRRSCSD